MFAVTPRVFMKLHLYRKITGAIKTKLVTLNHLSSELKSLKRHNQNPLQQLVKVTSSSYAKVLRTQA